MTTITRRSGVTATPGAGPRLAQVKNIASNPRAVTAVGLTTRWGTGGAASGSTSLMATGGPLANCRTFYRSTWSAPTDQPGTAQIANGAAGINLVTAGQKYVFKVYVRSSSTITIAPKFGWYKDSAYVGSATGTATTLVANKWTQLILEGVAPAGANRLQMNTDPTTASVPIPAGTTVDVTGWFPCEGSADSASTGDGSPAYADGDSAGWIWLGTPHASASQGYGAVLS